MTTEDEKGEIDEGKGDQTYFWWVQFQPGNSMGQLLMTTEDGRRRFFFRAPPNLRDCNDIPGGDSNQEFLAGQFAMTAETMRLELD